MTASRAAHRNPDGHSTSNGGGGRASMESARRIVRKPLPASARVSTHQPSPVDTLNPAEHATYPSSSAATSSSAQIAVGQQQQQQQQQHRENVPYEGGAALRTTTNGDHAEASGSGSGLMRGASVRSMPVVRKPLGPRQIAGTTEHEQDAPPPPYELLPSHLAREAFPSHDEDNIIINNNASTTTSPPLPAEDTTNTDQQQRAPPPLLRLNTLPPLPSTDLPPTQNDLNLPPNTLPSPKSPSRSPSPWSRHANHYSALPPPPPQSRVAACFTPFSLTLIRRDPGTGHQWNIGKVSSFQAATNTSPLGGGSPPHSDAAAAHHHHDHQPDSGFLRAGFPAINVHIETSGYARFRDFPAVAAAVGRMSGEMGRARAARDMKELAAQMLAQQQQQESQDRENGVSGGDDGEGGFTRQVTMAYGKSWTRNLKEAFGGKGTRSRSSSSTTTTTTTTEQPTHRHSGFRPRNGSGGSSTTGSDDRDLLGSSPPAPHAERLLATAADAHHVSAAAVLPPPPPNSRPKGYTFTSPWHGTCDFRTTSNGRALKCRHTRSTTSQGFNPLVAAQALRDAAASVSNSSAAASNGGRKRGLSASMVNGSSGGVGGGSTAPTAPVSELRFNLPATDLFHSKEDRERAAREVRRGLGELLSPATKGGYENVRFDEYGDEIVDEEGEGGRVFDWSALGREKAGGGTRGKRAKLGKLLVYDEGIKMLDLVVAANMGIWWTSWERSF
ncbi:unnamed protein product [Discula destructiva]